MSSFSNFFSTVLVNDENGNVEDVVGAKKKHKADFVAALDEFKRRTRTHAQFIHTTVAIAGSNGNRVEVGKEGEEGEEAAHGVTDKRFGCC